MIKISNFKIFFSVLKNKLLKFIADIIYKKEKVKNKIIVNNFLGRGYGETPKYIVEKIIEKDLDCEIVWLVRDLKESLPENLRKVKYGTLKSLYEYSTSKIWIDNARIGLKPSKKHNQKYLQVWHGSFAIKKIEKDAIDILNKNYIKSAIGDGKITDAILVENYAQETIFKRAFWLNNNVEYLRVGSPRNDFLKTNENNKELKKKIRDELKIKNDKFIILYAPTFRDDNSIEGYCLDFSKIIEEFEKKEKQEVIILIKLHPNVLHYSNLFSYSEKIININKYSDIQNLTLISDCLITDYSSVILDFAVLKKLVFICALDFKSYSEKRGISQEFFEIPFDISYSNEELINYIKKYDKEEYLKKLNMYLLKNPIYGNGKSTDEIFEWVKKNIENN